jgi:hypothetical protein
MRLVLTSAQSVPAPPPSDLSPESRRFIDRCVESVEQLEVLLLLLHAPDKSWTVDTVAGSLGMTRDPAATALERLGSRNLLDVRIADDVYYRFNPGSPDLAAGARALSAAYRESRVAVLGFLASRPARHLRDFADAFRLRNDGDS